MQIRIKNQSQIEFDHAKNGWTLCNADMLKTKIINCEKIAVRLEIDDYRHDTLKAMREALKVKYARYS